jgi:anti-sigma factor ChrR (cupin superfamily)
MTEQQEQQAIGYLLGEMSAAEQAEFAQQLRTDPGLREFVHSLQKTIDRVAVTVPQTAPAPELKAKVLRRIPALPQDGPPATQPPSPIPPGLRFLVAGEGPDWKALPVPGAFIKLLSLQRDRGYAVLMGKLEPGARYPQHTNVGPEDFYVLTGDLHIGQKALRAGDFHHAEAGSFHEENFSVDGCTLLAVLTVDDPLVAFAAS